MTLKELLAELRNNILRDVTYRVGASSDEYLWTDETLIRYINEAERKFCRMTQCLRDKTTAAVTQVTLQPDVAEYVIDKRVLDVLDVHIQGYQLRPSQNDALNGYPGNVATGSVNVKASRRGRPLLFSLDEADRTLRLYPIPSEEFAGTIAYLRVARLPLNPLTKSNLAASPEVDEDYHLELLEWAAWRALRNHDVDAENMAKASAHKTRFLQAVDEMNIDAKRAKASPVQFGVNARFD